VIAQSLREWRAVMLVQLRRGATPTVDHSRPEDLLLACHARIRAITELARRVANAEELADVAEASGRVRRFYSIALPLHAEDEDESVLPRLIHLSHDREVEHALVKMSNEHPLVDELCGRAADLYAALEAEPGRIVDLRPSLRSVLHEIDVLWQHHFGVEERVIFPALALLSLDDRIAIVRECRARREGEAAEVFAFVVDDV